MKRVRRKRIVKGVAAALAVLSILFVAELLRERFVYRRISNRIESAHGQLRAGMTKDEVRRVAGAPEEIARRPPDEYWTWTARGHQGELWGRLGLATAKGHYDLIVRFDGEDRITKIFGGVN
jgi:hypothetical protein